MPTAAPIGQDAISTSVVERIVENLRPALLDALSRMPPSPALACDAETLVIARESIGRFLNPQLFADPAFDILLHLYVAAGQGRRVATTDCGLAAHIAPTTALRWLVVLEREDLIVRHRDAGDGRRTFISLTSKASDGISRYLLFLQQMGSERHASRSES